MAIEITEFANVSITVTPSGVAGGDFGILGFLTNEEGVISSAQRSRAYANIKGVLADWEGDTEVALAATTFYAATPTPKDFVVLMCFETDQPATLTGGGHDTYEELVGISSGNFNIATDLGTVGIVVNFTNVFGKGLEGIAASLEKQINEVLAGAVEVAYTGYSFEIKSTTNGIRSTITYADGEEGLGDVNAAEALGLEQHQGAISTGLDSETPVQALGEVLSKGTDFTGLVTHKKYRDILTGDTGETTLEIASLMEGAKKIFMNTSNDLSILGSAYDGNNTDIISECKKATLRFTLSTFSKNKKQYPSAGVFGRAASVNFSGINTTITLNLKQIPTITAENLTPGEFANLRSKFGSAVVQIGKTVNAYSDSRMGSGSWFDTTHGLLWLENRCETDMFNLLYQTGTKIPFTQSGINTTKATLERSLEAAIRNGLGAPGFLPDGRYLPEGYIVYAVDLKDVASSDKSNRLYAGLSFELVGAGAMQELVVSGNFTE